MIQEVATVRLVFLKINAHSRQDLDAVPKRCGVFDCYTSTTNKAIDLICVYFTFDLLQELFRSVEVPPEIFIQALPILLLDGEARALTVILKTLQGLASPLP